MLKPLSARQQAFFDHYVTTRKVGDSYRAGYSCDGMTDANVLTEASRLLRTSRIQEELIKFFEADKKAKPEELSPEYLKAELKTAIGDKDDNGDYKVPPGPRMSAINTATKCFGMQTVNTRDVTETLADTDLALALASSHYPTPVDSYDDLDPEDKLFYSQLLERMNSTMQ